MTDLTLRLGRRSILKRIGAAGLALPAFGAFTAAGAGCSDESPAERQAAAQQALFDRENPSATPSAAATATQPAPAIPAPAAQSVDFTPLPNPQVAPPINRSVAAIVKVELEVEELDAGIAEGAGYRFWTFNGTVPGPMIRAREGDTIELTLTNPTSSAMAHNIDLHAVTGPGGGAAVTNVLPGETKTLRFKALHPGVFIYHCAVPPIPLHISNGMYGLIVVEPAEGLPAVDREFYICQGDIYTTAKAGSPGMHGWDLDRLDAENPSYVIFNGSIGSLTGDRSLKANVGETVRIYFGVGGPNLTSAFHVIGEIFDRAAIHGSFADMARDVQTVTVSPGAATMVEFDLQVPGTYTIVDHALSRLGKGAAGLLVVEGDENPEIYEGVS